MPGWILSTVVTADGAGINTKTVSQGAISGGIGTCCYFIYIVSRGHFPGWLAGKIGQICDSQFFISIGCNRNMANRDIVIRAFIRTQVIAADLKIDIRGFTQTGAGVAAIAILIIL